jgi:hypothetical protein
MTRPIRTAGLANALAAPAVPRSFDHPNDPAFSS